MGYRTRNPAQTRLACRRQNLEASLTCERTEPWPRRRHLARRSCAGWCVDWVDGTMSAHHVVVVGAGFGGLETVHRLAGAPVEITIVDRRNYHLFQPLLYQAATASLAPSEIAWPIRQLFRP